MSENGTDGNIAVLDRPLEPEEAAKVGAAIALWSLPRTRVVVPIVGLTPLIPGKFGEKARSMMREKQQGRGVGKKRAPKNPEQEAEDRTYRLANGGFGVPAVNFKAAIVDGCRFVEGITMTNAQRAFSVQAEGQEQLVPITGDAEMREDFVRNATGVADIRYRYSLWPWRAELDITVKGFHVEVEAIVNIVDAAGIGGVCEWRPSKAKSGIYGAFEVDRMLEINVVEQR